MNQSTKAPDAVIAISPEVRRYLEESPFYINCLPNNSVPPEKLGELQAALAESELPMINRPCPIHAMTVITILSYHSRGGKESQCTLHFNVIDKGTKLITEHVTHCNPREQALKVLNMAVSAVQEQMAGHRYADEIVAMQTEKRLQPQTI